MTDNSPTPPNRQDPQLDPANDSDEPAFEWMKTAAAGRNSDIAPGNSAAAGGTAAAEAAAPGITAAEAATTGAATPEAAAPVRRQPGGRADRRAAEAAVESPGTTTARGPDQGPDSGSGAVFSEPLATSALQIRPPQEEVERRNAEREHAANAKPVAPRVMQILLAVCFPIILLVLAVRAVASPLFLWVEYNRPGFPGDGYGFSTDDRMTYGSYAVDYLSNWSGPRYLGELVNRSGDKLFMDGEVSHMADVKLVIMSAFGAGALLLLLSLIAVIYLRRRSTGGVRRGLFAGSVATLAVIIGLGTLAVLGWEQFFTQFHAVFFANGTWTFSLQDTLIRLFPGQFWVDGGITIGGLVLLVSLGTLILTWPTRKRRGLPKRGTVDGGPAGDAAAVAAADAPAEDAADPAAVKGSRFRWSKARKAEARQGGAEGEAQGTVAVEAAPAGVGAAAQDSADPADGVSRRSG
ncbi:TIGR01906 family membrane protein [Arthrobacter sp. CG_A4]|uniref:TIGR01906 family membrane protein n=1 Tax=Arthrobacter sp. CG_A4 TaxID=3071706 RepID=UPI002E091E87|nr:integral membrane protein (TIGR01906 family) [Arthrobacter sp. CG_A4]